MTSKIRAQPGPQEAFLSSAADLAIYGGAAGGGKTFALLLEALRHVRNPQFRAVIFRRTSVQVRNPGGLWDESLKLYPLIGGKPREYLLEWEFPSGASIKFAHMEHEKNRLDWQGSQIPFIAFDELSHFTRDQFMYMLSRNRSMCGVRPYMRATCNPAPDDDPVGGWLHELVGWYIGEDGYAIPERSGTIRWFAVIGDDLRWADSAEELRAAYPGCEPKSFTFIMSSVFDNQILLRADPGYLANLMALPLVDRERLLGDGRRGGNWKIRPAAGRIFNRGWFEIVDAAPADGQSMRFWDLAATEKTFAKTDPDFTAGVLMRRVGDTYYILDAIAEQAAPGRVDALLRNTATQDGVQVAVRFEREGGASGVRDARTTVALLAGFDVRAVAPRGDKIMRAKPLAAQAEAGNVKIVRGPWNDRFLRTLHVFPEGAHDDEVDAASGAFNELQRVVRQQGTHHG